MSQMIRCFSSAFCAAGLLVVFCVFCGAEEGQGVTPAVIRNTADPNVPPSRVPEPILLEPVRPVVDISGKQFVAFRWESRENPCRIWYYVFRLYKGYEAAAVRQIYAKEVSVSAAGVAISRDYFKDGESYTWSVVQVDAGPFFSEPSFHTFRVTKKEKGGGQ
jgi:hypothetical protein